MALTTRISFVFLSILYLLQFKYCCAKVVDASISKEKLAMRIADKSSTNLICQYSGYCRSNSDCIPGNKCNVQNGYYSQCIPDPSTYLTINCLSNYGEVCNDDSTCCDPGSYCNNAYNRQCEQPRQYSSLCTSPNFFLTPSNSPTNAPSQTTVPVAVPTPFPVSTLSPSLLSIYSTPSLSPESSVPSIVTTSNSTSNFNSSTLTPIFSVVRSPHRNQPPPTNTIQVDRSRKLKKFVYSYIIQQKPTSNPTFLSQAKRILANGSPSVHSTSSISVAVTTSTPSKKPSAVSTRNPTSLNPTLRPSTLVPSTLIPSGSTNSKAKINPTKSPTIPPTSNPTAISSYKPTLNPSKAPSPFPSRSPSNLIAATKSPSISPTNYPTIQSSIIPSTRSPSAAPTTSPSTNLPSASPSGYPTLTGTSLPTTNAPSYRKTYCPSYLSTSVPSTTLPTIRPTILPTTESPSQIPSVYPVETTALPSPFLPSVNPSVRPSNKPHSIGPVRAK